MSRPEAAGGAGGAPVGGDPAPLTPDAIDAVLADFRGWLLDLAQRSDVGDQKSEQARGPGLSSVLCPLTSGVDLFTLVGQFTALRHDVNLQTKAARAAVEQNAEVLKQLAAAKQPAEPESSEEGLRPLLKAVIDVADVLALSLRQVEKLRESVGPLLDQLTGPPWPVRVEPLRPGFLARLLGATLPQPPEPPGVSPEAREAAAKLRQLADAAADGYAMSLRRVERVLPTFGLEPIRCKDGPFDPERMEVVEVVTDRTRPSGAVAEEVRPGYLWRGKVFRFAQVKVTR